MKRELISKTVLIAAGLFAASTTLAATSAVAEVQSRQCPFSCQSEGIPKAQCRDWKEGNTCFVDDTRPNSDKAARMSREGDRWNNDDRRDNDRRDYDRRDDRGDYERRDRDPRDSSRDIQMVESVIRSGERRSVELHDERIVRVDVVAARTRRSGENTQLELALENSGPIAAPQQVDRDDKHVIRYDVNTRNPRGRELLLRAHDGDVFVESVHVFYDRN